VLITCDGWGGGGAGSNCGGWCATMSPAAGTRACALFKSVSEHAPFCHAPALLFLRSLPCHFQINNA